MNITPLHMGQAALVIGTGVAGFNVLSGVLENSYRDDLIGDPNQVVDRGNGYVIDQPRKPQANGHMQQAMFFGAVGAGLGAALSPSSALLDDGVKDAAQGAAQVAKSASKLALLRPLGGAALFGAGVGVLAGAIDTARRFQDTVARRED